MSGAVRGGDGLAAVPCEDEDVIALVALDGEVLGTIPVGSDPVHATAHAGRIFVATMGERSVTAIGDGGEVRRVETGVLGPSHFAVAPGQTAETGAAGGFRRGDDSVDPDDSDRRDRPGRSDRSEPRDDRGVLLVPCTAGDVVAAIDPGSLELLGRVPTGAEPHEIAVAGDLALVGSRADGLVSVLPCGVAPEEAARRRADVDIGDSARVQGVATPPAADGTTANGATDAGPVFAVDQHGARVVRLDVPDGSDPDSVTVVSEAGVGADPYDATVTDDRIFVAGRGDGTVHELDHDLATVAVSDVGGAPEDVVVAEGMPWVYFRDEARLVALDGNERIDLPSSTLHAVTTDRGLLCSHYDDDAVSLVDLARGDVRWTVETPARPFGAVVV